VTSVSTHYSVTVADDRVILLMPKLFVQTEVVQVDSVQAVQTGTQAFADYGPSTPAGRCGPLRRGIHGRGAVGSTGPDAGRQSDHGVGKCRLSHLICATDVDSFYRMAAPVVTMFQFSPC